MIEVDINGQLGQLLTTYSVLYEKKPMLTFDTIEESSFKASSTLTGYPTESGVTVTDYKFDNPDTVTLRGIASRASVLSAGDAVTQIKANLKFLKSGVYLCEVKTRNDTYKDLSLVDYEIFEDADNFGALVVDMTFEQVIRLDGNTSINANPADNDTLDGGLAFIKRIL